MTSTDDELFAAFESHSVERIDALLERGLDVHAPIDGKTPVNHLIEMYYRSDQFPACLQLLLDHGAQLDDPKLAPVLLDHADALSAALQSDPALLTHRTSMACTFTPLMHLLLQAGARTDILLAGITWGKGFQWETVCFDVTPVSYAQLGLLPQMQRTEQDCYANVVALLQAAGRKVPVLSNVPNRYLQ